MAQRAFLAAERVGQLLALTVSVTVLLAKIKLKNGHHRCMTCALVVVQGRLGLKTEEGCTMGACTHEGAIWEGSKVERVCWCTQGLFSFASSPMPTP